MSGKTSTFTLKTVPLNSPQTETKHLSEGRQEPAMPEAREKCSTTSGTGEGVATVEEEKVGEISHRFCPVSSGYQQLIAVGKSSTWRAARCQGQCGCAKPSSRALTPSYSLCPQGICRSCSDFTWLERATPNALLSRGVSAPTMPRALAKARIPGRASLPGVGRSMGGRLLATGAEQPPWYFFASLINHEDTGKVYSYSRQAASQTQRRREIPLSPCLLQGYFWKRQKPGEVFGSIPSPWAAPAKPRSCTSKQIRQNLPPLFPLQGSSRHGRVSLAGGCAGRSCSLGKPILPGCLRLLLS